MLNIVDAENVINALRNGTSPQGNASAILSGRDSEIKEFKRCLELIGKGTGVTKVIVGNYGTGKTFLTQCLKQIALNEEYITASFQINNGFRLNKIEDLFYAIMHSLTLKSRPNEKVGFDDVFNLWVENLQNAPNPELKRHEINSVCQALSKYNMTYARAFLSFMRGRIQRNQEMIQVTSAWLSGEQNIPFALKEKYGLVGNVGKTNAIDFINAFVKLITLLDYKGLVVFIDEIDQLLNERSDIRQAAYSNLKHLIDLATSGETPHLMIVFTGTKEAIVHPDKGLITYSALAQRLNLEYRKAYHFKDLMQPVVEIDSLNNDELLKLTQKVLKIYQLTRPIPYQLTADSIYNEVIALSETGNFQTRHFVTRLIQRLDEEV